MLARIAHCTLAPIVCVKEQDTLLNLATPTSKRSATEIDLHVGCRIRERRMTLGMARDKLAEALGITFQQIQKCERGINRVNAGRLFEMATVLDVPVAYFYEGLGARGKSETTNPIGDLLATREGIELAQAFCAISDPRQRRSIVQVA